MRFVAVQEPPGSSWVVFDTAEDAPAEYAGRVLVGLTSREARWFVAMGNDHTAWPATRPAGHATAARRSWRLLAAKA
jgi:hypothetical protein